MPPKAPKQQASKKTEMKKKEKVIEDKTFGLKNKKGAKMQKFVQQVEKQVKSGGAKVPEKKKKEDEEDPTKDLFKPVIVQKALDKNVDPKSVLCAFFKSGQCSKGNKCKFSHDPEIERRAEKRNLYVDERKEEDETMEDWDEAKLEEVVSKKHGKTKPITEIICKFFLDAVENNKYGWFWECPNGNEKCHYRHALPAGFVLKKDKKKMLDQDKENTLTLEDLIEEERKKLGSSGSVTKVTLESFLAWKRKKRKERKEQAEKDLKQKQKDFRRGLSVGLSGREMFDFDPSLVSAEDGVGEDEASFDISALKKENGEEGAEGDNDEGRFEFKEIDLAALTLLGDEEEDENAGKKSDEPEGAVGGPIDESLFDEEALGLDDDDEELNGVD